MLYSLRQRKVARVLFDESHGEAWSVRPDVAAAIQPEHPAGSSYALAAAALAERDFEVAAIAAGPLSADALAAVDVLVIAHPSDARWERTVGGSPCWRAPRSTPSRRSWPPAAGWSSWARPKKTSTAPT